MCDYSLEEYRSRPAQQGEMYQTYRFPSGSVGFIAPGDTSTAVCMACDTRLKLEGIPESVRQIHGVRPNEDVTFIRLDTRSYRDGVRFANGVIVHLQRLGPGVSAFVTDALLTPRRELETVHAI